VRRPINTINFPGTFMSARKSTSIAAIALLLANITLSGCGSDSPELMLASAKDYMAKDDTKAAVIQLKNVLQHNPNLGEA
jgi:Tfp pilus assembly protein PilF